MPQAHAKAPCFTLWAETIGAKFQVRRRHTTPPPKPSTAAGREAPQTLGREEALKAPRSLIDYPITRNNDIHARIKLI